MCLQKVTSRKNCVKKLVFFLNLKVNDKNGRSRIRIRVQQSKAWIRGSGSTSKCHGSGTLIFSIHRHKRISDLVEGAKHLMSLQGSILKILYNGSTWKVPGASMIFYLCLQITISMDNKGLFKQKQLQGFSSPWTLSDPSND